jgi:alpha-tubulin suppressor-like RCC1 family protein
LSALSLGSASACALFTAGTVECWGANYYGQLGIGMTTGPDTCGSLVGSNPCSTAPVAVMGLAGVVTALSVGDSVACALLSGGTVQCWGANQYGQLGNGSTTGPDKCSNLPCAAAAASAVTGLTGVTAVAVGSTFACALLSGGTVQCWGDNSYGELGIGSMTGPDTCNAGPCWATPAPAVTGLTGVTSIAVGDQFACALLSAGTVQCWGDNKYGELGNGMTTGPRNCGGVPCSPTPVSVMGLAGKVTALSFGGASGSACALLSGGDVQCWGDNTDGQLGMTTGPVTCPYYSTLCSPTPVTVKW